jgi:peptidoglycan/xylan/chitin deacetylase (PgdA/CDA1 family)
MYVLKALLFYLGVFALIRRLNPRKELAVLRYHAVCPRGCSYASPGISVTPGAFTQQIRYLSKHYPILPLDEAVARLSLGESLPANAIAITFDDGYQDNYAAFKILKEYGVPATFFLTTNCIDDKELFWVSEVYHLISQTKYLRIQLSIKNHDVDFALESPHHRQAAISRITNLLKSCTIPEREAIREQLRAKLNDVDLTFRGSPLMLASEQISEMLAAGMAIGAHTLTHCNLPSAGSDDAQHEITQSRIDLETTFGTHVNAFAYPNGGASAYFNPEIKDFVQQAGYLSAWTSEQGFVNVSTDLYCCPRVVMTESLVEALYLLEGERLKDSLQKHLWR